MGIFKNWLIDALGKRTDYFDWRIYQKPLDIDRVESVCILHLNDKIGDGMMFSLLIDALAKARPGLPIHVGTTAAFVPYWRRHPAVREVATFPISLRRGRGTVRRTLAARRAARPWAGRFDLVVSFESYARADHFALLRILAPKTLIGFNKGPYRLFDYSLDEGRHGLDALPVSSRVVSVLRVFGLQAEPKALRVHVPHDAEEDERARRALETVSVAGPRLLLHVYGYGSEKILTPPTAARAVRELRAAGHDGALFVGVPGGQVEIYEACFVREGVAGPDVAVLGPRGGMFDLFAFVAQMDAVVSADTSVGHIAAAFRKPQVCVFARWGNISAVWKPLNDRCFSVVSTTGETANDIDWSEFASAAAAMLAARNEAASARRPGSVS